MTLKWIGFMCLSIIVGGEGRATTLDVPPNSNTPERRLTPYASQGRLVKVIEGEGNLATVSDDKFNQLTELNQWMYKLRDILSPFTQETYTSSALSYDNWDRLTSITTPPIVLEKMYPLLTGLSTYSNRASSYVPALEKIQERYNHICHLARSMEQKKKECVADGDIHRDYWKSLLRYYEELGVIHQECVLKAYQALQRLRDEPQPSETAKKIGPQEAPLVPSDVIDPASAAAIVVESAQAKLAASHKPWWSWLCPCFRQKKNVVNYSSKSA